MLLALVEGGGRDHHLPDAVLVGGLVDEGVESRLELLLDGVVLGLDRVHPLLHERVHGALHGRLGLLAHARGALLGLEQPLLELLLLLLEVLDVREHVVEILRFGALVRIYWGV